MMPKYQGNEHCHLALVTSFGVAVLSSCLYTCHLAQLSIMMFHPFCIISNYKLKPNLSE